MGETEEVRGRRRCRRGGEGAKGGGTVNNREKDRKHTCKNNGHEVELEPASQTDRDDCDSSSSDAVTGLGLGRLDGVASLHASDEQEQGLEIYPETEF